MTLPVKILSLVFLCSLPCLLAACASPGTSSTKYQSPAEVKTIPTERVVNKPFSDVWDILVRDLAKSFFVINNIDKASRIVNVSFSSSQPSEYVDCGQSTRTFEYNEEFKKYEYLVANSSTFKVAGSWGPYNNLPTVSHISRRTSLEGRANIYVAPKEDSVTLVTANVRYILSMIHSGTMELSNAYGNVVQHQNLPEKVYTPISFNTNQTGEGEIVPPSTERVLCRSKGILEAQLLDMATH